MTKTRRVFRYDNGSRLDGTPSDDLIDASDADAKRTGTGAVAAYLDDSGVWQHVAEQDADAAKRRGIDVITVYVEA